MRIFNLSNKSGSLTSSDKFVLDNGTNVMKIDYNALAKAIIEQYTGSSLAGSAQSVKAALDALNSKRIYLNWGNTLTFTLPTGHQALVLVGNTELHILWNPADSLNQNVVWSNNGTVGTTISRGSSITEVVISRASNSTIAVLIM